MNTDPSKLLLQHCLSLGGTGEERPSAKLRLEEEIGPDLTRKLLSSLTSSDRR